LNSSAFWRATSVVWKWSDILDRRHVDTYSLQRTNSRLTTRSRTFYEYFYFTQTKFECHLTTVLSRRTSSIRSVLFRTSKTHLTCARPRDSLTLIVGQSNDDVVKRSVDMRLTYRLNNDDTFFCSFFTFSHFLLII